jgi:flavodoxin
MIRHGLSSSKGLFTTKAVIIYDSVSKTKMTEKVANIVRDGLKEKGIEADAFLVTNAGSVKVEDYDCFIIGSPTMKWSPTAKTKKFLEGLAGKQLSGKMASSFDTQMKSMFSGNANKKMKAKLTQLGFKTVGTPLQAYVKGGKEGYQLNEGEADRIKAWAISFAEAAGKK